MIKTKYAVRHLRDLISVIIYQTQRLLEARFKFIRTLHANTLLFGVGKPLETYKSNVYI